MTRASDFEKLIAKAAKTLGCKPDDDRVQHLATLWIARDGLAAEIIAGKSFDASLLLKLDEAIKPYLPQPQQHIIMQYLSDIRHCRKCGHEHKSQPVGKAEHGRLRIERERLVNDVIDELLDAQDAGEQLSPREAIERVASEPEWIDALRALRRVESVQGVCPTCRTRALYKVPDDEIAPPPSLPTPEADPKAAPPSVSMKDRNNSFTRGGYLKNPRDVPHVGGGDAGAVVHVMPASRNIGSGLPRDPNPNRDPLTGAA